LSYQVLARKWRPRRFEDLVGQAHVRNALVHELEQQRPKDAYLFTGTRGVGKTTVARIFAKALNCEQGISATPCGTCSSCLEADEGRFVDLIEVDAASRTKVEDTRDLLDSVSFLPTRGRFKVYLIDEVHMFSNHSFNALLKTLEEPPPHVKFLLATTDPKKLPPTILSRCQQHNLKMLTAEQIEQRIEEILKHEKIKNDRAARRLVARAANGSLRDALSLLDQAIASGGGALREAEVSAMLGAVNPDTVIELLERIADQDAKAVLAVTERMAEYAPDYLALLGELASDLELIATTQLVPGSNREDTPESQRLAKLAQTLSPETVQLFYQFALMGRRDLPLAPDPKGFFQMVLWRMLAFELTPSGPRTAGAAPAGNSPPARSTACSAPAGRPAATQQDAATSGAPATSQPRLSNQPQAASSASIDWQTLIDELKLTGMVRELAANSAFAGFDGRTFELLLAPHCERLRSKPREASLEKALQARFGAELRVKLRVAEEAEAIATPVAIKTQEQNDALARAKAAIEEDPNVQALRQAFDAEVIEGSIEPLGD
jgi:DNA polymerase-3 subunit gamma/tau